MLDLLSRRSSRSPALAGKRKRMAQDVAWCEIEIEDGWGSPKRRRLEVMLPTSRHQRQKCRALWVLAEDVPFVLQWLREEAAARGVDSVTSSENAPEADTAAISVDVAASRWRREYVSKDGKPTRFGRHVPRFRGKGKVPLTAAEYQEQKRAALEYMQEEE